MSKQWQPYALYILDTIAKIRRIQARGDIRQDEVLYDATLRNLQTLSEATQLLPAEKRNDIRTYPGARSAVFATSWFTTTWVISTHLPSWPSWTINSNRWKPVCAACWSRNSG